MTSTTGIVDGNSDLKRFFRPSGFGVVVIGGALLAVIAINSICAFSIFCVLGTAVNITAVLIRCDAIIFFKMRYKM
jgi:hypothetical protein